MFVGVFLFRGANEGRNTCLDFQIYFLFLGQLILFLFSIPAEISGTFERG